MNEVKEILKDIEDNNCIFIKGITGSGKTTLCKKLYRELLQEKIAKSSEVLVFISSRGEGIKWRQDFDFETSRGSFVMNYMSFVKKEVKLWWPLISEKCPLIINKKVIPSFASRSISESIMEGYVKSFREEENYFEEIRSSNYNIASSILSNMEQCALNVLDFKEIAIRIENSQSILSNKELRVYSEMDYIIKKYTEKLLESSVLDNALSLFVFNEYLMKEEMYLNSLKKYKYILCDNFEEASYGESILVESFLKNNCKGAVFYNEEGGICDYYGKSKENIKNLFKYKNKTITLIESYTSSEYFKKLAEDLYSEDSYIKKGLGKNIEVEATSKLYSEMVSKLCSKVEGLLEKGEKEEDIVIITPSNNLLINYSLENFLSKFSRNIIKNNKNKNLLDYIENKSLLILANLFLNYKISFTEEDYRNVFSYIFNLNIVEGSLLAKEVIGNHELLNKNQEDFSYEIDFELYVKYRNLCQSIINYREEALGLSETLKKLYLDFILPLGTGEETIKNAKNLFNEVDNFISILKELSLSDRIANYNIERMFIDKLREGIKDFYSSKELSDLEGKTGINIMTPYGLLAKDKSYKYELLVDGNSTLWAVKNIRELSNPYVFKKDWNRDEAYTDKIDFINRRNNLEATIKILMRKCTGKMIIFSSEYSINGYEEEGMLSSIMSKIMEGEEQWCLERIKFL